MSGPLINARRIAAALVETLRIEWARARADMADTEIREQRRAGVRDSESLRQYAAQRDAWREYVAALETRRLLQRLTRDGQPRSRV